tara:strand:- start:7344 stop:8648 length:1305 start_codon:yes stop_codon:yes gene_type:complete
MSESNNLIVNKSSSLVGMIQVPGDKSISHRSIILGSITEGSLTIKNFLHSDDCLNTISAMRQLGVSITIDENNIHIKGLGLLGLTKPKNTINVGNSGTLIRLLAGVLATQNFTSSLTGDSSLRSRPMARILKPLKSCGADIYSDSFRAPLKINPQKEFSCIEYNQEIASAQVKSCLILAALFIKGEHVFYEKIPTRDHTENLLQHFNYDMQRTDNKLVISGQQKLIAKDIEIASDISSAAFFIVAALISEGSEIVIPNVNINKYRTGIIKVLKKMKATINFKNIREVSNEKVADIEIKYSKLESINLDGEIISTLIDELPILFIACAVSQGTSNISGIEELRYKESDRIKAMEEGLSAIGIKVSSTSDSIKITGSQIIGGKVNSYGDHRIAMSFAIAGIVSKKSITINDTKNISTSFPTFVNLLREQGVNVFEI